jgi:glycosyltransferase involved in cell wall biosynthesis
VRILAVANHLGSRGGLERTQMVNCRGLGQRGHELDLVYVSDGEFTASWQEFAATMIRTETTLPRRARPYASSAAVVAAVRRARRLRPDVVYVYRHLDVPFAVAVAAATGAVVVLHLCLPPPSSMPRWLRAGLRRVDATVAVSHDTAERWHGSGLPPETVSVAHTAIDLDTYVPGTAEDRERIRSEEGIGPEDFAVIFAGRLSPEKGVDVLVDAFARLCRRVDGVRLVVLGSATLGTDAEAARRYAERLRELASGLPVTWIPGRNDVVPLLQACDAAVVPSVWPEPLSRSILEALACGVPVIATRVGGSPEVLVDWLSWFLVEPGDAEDLAERLAALQEWRGRDPRLGERCRRAAEERLSLDDELRLVEDAMVRAVARRRGSTRPSIVRRRAPVRAP